jgi:hypothetical protein
MTERRRDERDVPTNAPHVGDLDTTGADVEMLTDEELERAQMGWEGEDERRSVPSNAPNVGDLEADADDVENLMEKAEDAIIDMEAREMRRNDFRTPGDDHAPGVDYRENAPKQDEMNKRKPAGNRGQSDWN